MQVLSLTGKGFQLLLPVNMVAQILGRTALSESVATDTGYVIGSVGWREFQVPVCASSRLLGFEPAADRDYERVVVLWPMKSAHTGAFMGLTSLTAPRVIDIVDPTSPEHPPELDFALDYLMIDGELGVIPDIERLSNTLYTETANQP